MVWVLSLVHGGLGKLRASPKPEARKSEEFFEPSYLRLHRQGELRRRGAALWDMLEECRLCPRECGVNRRRKEKGFCDSTSDLRVASFHPHFGEEKGLVGRFGSGTIFFSGCSLRCVFCINWPISQGGQGEGTSLDSLARMMLELQDRGCPNINIVTPTHFSAHLVRALDIAAGLGLKVPLVYNTCGWERLEILRLLDGVVDVYLPDFKYADADQASRYSSGADSYPELTRRALLEMNRQVGVARTGADGLIRRGLMIRHLVMPSRVSGSAEVFRWIGDNLPRDTYVNIMSQYRPVYKAKEYPEINRRITRDEYRGAVEAAREAGLTNLDIQGDRS